MTQTNRFEIRMISVIDIAIGASLSLSCPFSYRFYSFGWKIPRNMQLFTVRSGGATGVAVKGLAENDTLTFCMEDKGAMSSIKFSPDHKLLAIQRTENCVEFLKFANNQPNVADAIVHQSKSATAVVHGFVWIHNKEVALISNTGVEIFSVNMDKKQLKSIKSLSLTTDWFSWCPTGNLAVLSSNKGMLLTPILIKQGGVMTRLPKIECTYVGHFRVFHDLR